MQIIKQNLYIYVFTTSANWSVYFAHSFTEQLASFVRDSYSAIPASDLRQAHDSCGVQ